MREIKPSLASVGLAAALMSSIISTTIEEEDLWGGGNRPFKASYGKLMMWFFIVSDALSFSGFLVDQKGPEGFFPFFLLENQVGSRLFSTHHHQILIADSIFSFQYKHVAHQVLHQWPELLGHVHSLLYLFCQKSPLIFLQVWL